MSDPRLIVFDVDGTLIDSQVVIIKAMAAAYRAVGLQEPSDAQTLSIVGLSLPEAMRGISPELDEDTVEALVEAYRATFLERRAKGEGEASVPLYPGARDCLMRLNENPSNVLGAATGKARRGLDVVIEAHGLEGAIAETGIASDQAVMIGDTSFDMEMGKAAGLATIGVAWGYHDLERLSVHADRIVSAFDQVDQAIVELLGAN